MLNKKDILKVSNEQNASLLLSSDKLLYFSPEQPKKLNESTEHDLQSWQNRHTNWFGHQLVLSPKNIRQLMNGGFVKEERRFAEYTRIVTSWLGHEEYHYEQRIDYRFERKSSINKLGIKCVHIERDIYNNYRIGIVCNSTDHYAHLYTILERAGLPVDNVHKWAMLPYSLQIENSALAIISDLMSVIRSNTHDKVQPIIDDILQKFSTLN